MDGGTQSVSDIAQTYGGKKMIKRKMYIMEYWLIGDSRTGRRIARINSRYYGHRIEMFEWR